MATKTFTALTAVTTLAAGDELVQWNAAAGAARKITVANFIANSPNGGLAEKGAANTFAATQTFMHPSSTTTIHIDAAAGQARAINLRTAGVNRWILQSVNNTESGSNAGSDLDLLARTDAGGAIRTVLSLIRSTGFIGLGGTPATSAVLDLQATTGALLVPRMTSVQRDALTPSNGMIIYNTTTATMQGYIASAWANM